ncbi:Fpg/Nei family DNA glycosylase [Guyparkeria sp.]|uniref:Fpg/Nei family DNA glycosylase n=1 Tax=Guyparkeria sp. TaxID=2035736 RepID=UPI003561B67A
MPELPDVETFRRTLDAHGLGRPVRRTTVSAPDLLADISPQSLGRLLKNHSLVETRRHGKYLFTAREGRDGWLVLHFGMSGTLVMLEGKGAQPEHAGLVVTFDHGGVAYDSPRRLGMIGWTESPEAFAASRELGPDALAIDRESFVSGLRGYRGAIKCWLMDQARLAGIGNVYSDEILFQAGLHPKHAGNSLNGTQAESVYGIMQRVLEGAVAAGADPARLPDGYLLPNRGEGGRCPACGEALDTVRACGRTAWYCPHCQAPDEVSG